MRISGVPESASLAEILWSVMALAGVFIHLLTLWYAIDDERNRRSAGINGARQVVSTGALVRSVGRLLSSLAFSYVGVLAVFSTGRAGFNPLVLAILFGAGIIVVLGAYDLFERQWLVRALDRRRAVIDPTIDGIIAMDGEGKIVTWNLGAERLWGWTDEEVLGKPVTMLMPARLRNDHVTAYQRLQAGGPSTILGRAVRLPILRKDGTERMLRFVITAQPGPDSTQYVAVVKEPD